MERIFSKNKDSDRIILQHLDDKDLLQLVLVNKYAHSLADENFWMNRLNIKYPSTVQFKENQSWKEYYLSIVYYIDMLKNKYKYIYIKGDPKYIYDIFKRVKSLSYSTTSQKEFYQRGYEDLSMIFANRLRREFGYPEFKLNTPEWEHYKREFLL